LCSISHRLHSLSPNTSSPAGDKNSDCSAAELYLDVSRADSDLRKINEGVIYQTG